MGHLPHARFDRSRRTVVAMNRYIIQRNVPGAGQLSAQELQSIARKSVEVLDSMDGRIQWNESFVTGDKLVLHLPRRR